MDNKPLSEKLTSTLDQADDYYDNGSYDNAIKCYNETNKKAEQLKCIDDKDYTRFTCRSWIGLMKSKYQLHQLDKVKKDFEAKKSHFKEKFLNSLLAEAQYIMGNVSIENGEYDEALRNFKVAIRNLNSNESNSLLTLVQGGKASVYMLQYKYDMARSVILESVREQLRSMQNSIEKMIENEKTEKTTENCKPQNVKKSITVLRNIQKILEETTVNSTPSNLSKTLLDKLKSSLPSDTKMTVKLALLNDTIGNLFYMQGDYLRAIECFWRSYRIKKKNFKDNSWHIIDSAEYLGKAYFALDQLKEANSWFKIVIKKNKDYEEYNDHQFSAKINNILGEIALRTRKVKRKKDKESDYNSFKGSTLFYNRVVNVPEDTYRNKVELSKAFYGIGKAYLKKSRFKTAKENLVKSKEILNGISNHRRLLIADIRDEIAKLYKSLNKLDASKKEYMESLKFRKEICDKYSIDFVRSYYSETRWEKYICSNDSILASDRSCLADIKKQKPYEEMKTAYHKLREIYELLSGRPYSLINRENNGNNGNSCNEQDIEDIQWLKDEIDKIAKFIEKPLGSNEGNDGETNVTIRSDNSSDHPGITSGINNKKSNMKDTTANISPVKNRNSKTNKRIRGYNGSNDKDHSQRKTTSKTFMSLKTNGQHSQSETSEQLVTSSSSETAIKEFHEAYEKAFECGNCLNNLANIMLIGPNHEGKSFIYKSLTKQTESYFNNAPVLINLDALTQASNSDEEIILDRQSFIDRKVLSVIEEQGNISVSPELQRIFSTTLQSNDQTNNAKSIAISGSDKVSVHNSDIDCQLNDNNTKVVETRTNILNLLNKDSNPLSSPLLSRCFQKFHQRRKYNHDSHFAKVWNFDNHAYYQPFKFQHNLYIAPFDVSVELDKIVRGGHSIDCYDYVTSFQEWLINTIDWNTNENQIYVEIGSQEENIPLPVILLVATNRDEKLEEQVQWARRKQFMDELDIKMPRHQLHFYSPEIIITLNDGNQKNNLEKTVNDRSWSELCRIIDAFILNFPFFKRRIKLKWYILAESFLTISIRDKTIDNTPNNNNCGGKEYIQTLQQISTKANNQLEPEEITKVLEFLHGIGDILFSSRSQADGLLIADIHWFIDNLNKISTLVGEEHHLANSGSSRKYCKWAKDYGMITKASVRYATHKKMLEEKDINSLLQVMLQNHLIYKFTRNLEKKPSSKSEQYFFPRLLPLGNIKSGNESSCGFQSTWLYLGFDENVLLYVTDQIFYQFLLLSQSKLDVEVLIYYDSAKYLPKHHNYAIIVNKKGSRIRIQYCYKTIGEQETDLKIKKEAISALNNDQLHIHLKKLLSEIVKNAYPETQEVDCEYFIDCPSCHQLMMICSSHFVTKIIECTNIKCCAKYLLAIMKDWISVLHESSSPCKNAQSLTSNQDVTSPNPSIASMCDEEDNPKLLANRVEESYNTNSSVNYNTPSPKRKASEIGNEKISEEQLLQQSRIGNKRKKDLESEDENESDQFDSAPGSPEEMSSSEKLESTSSVSTDRNKRKRYSSDHLSEILRPAHKRSNDSDNVGSPSSQPSLSEQVHRILVHYREEFTRKAPFDNIKQALVLRRVVASEDIDIINEKKTKQEKSAALFEIFFNRDDQDFEVLCDVLEKHHVAALQQLGIKMRSKATDIS